MTTLDYFLYDNRTWTSGIGRDWGVKAATGVLATRSDLRSMFDRYCGALPSDHGYLSGFGQALGGVRPLQGDGYLLCITVETADPFGRPSWALYGLWCPDTDTLENALASDPIGAAQSALGADTPPRVIALRSLAAALLPVPRRHREETTFRRFAGPSSISEAISLLLGAIRGRTSLPNVLGITASSRLPELGRQFEIVYCHPLSDRCEWALEQCRSDEPFEIVEPETTVSAPPAPARMRPAIVWAPAFAAAIAIVIVFAWPRAESSSETALRVIETQLDEIRALDPEDLRDIAQQDDRQELLDAYDSLIQDRERVIAIADAASLQKVRPILDQRPLGADACRVIGTASPTVRHWCEAFANLERSRRASS